MTGDQFKSIRKGLGLSLRKFGQALGYSGNANTLSVHIRRYESGNREHIPEWIARLAIMYQRFGIPKEWLK